LRNRVEAALASPEDCDAYRAALEATIEESDQLIKTFNALLMIARMEAGSQDGAMAEVEIGSVVRDVAELYEPAAEEKGVTLAVEVGEPVTLKANRELLGQALANLVDNALKYATPPAAGGEAARITISVSRSGNQVALSVADNGPGIPPADRGRVLQRFVRLEESRSLPGSGLGLSLVAAVANLHHGTVELGDGNPGLVVTLRLPLDRPEQ
jgi:signal transduction histidine kinase